MRTRVRLAALSVLPLLAASLTSCSSPTKIRLGYLPELNQAPAIVGIDKGYFAKQLGHGALKATAYSDEETEVNAFLAGNLDAIFVGPNGALTAFEKAAGKVRIVSGMTIGGTAFVTSAKIVTQGDLKGKKIATPASGSTQDIALRTWLANRGFKENSADGGDVSIVHMAPANTLDAFKDGAISGAWLPEPWATRLVVDGKGALTVQEANLWNEGLYSSGLLLVNLDYLNKHQDAVNHLLAGLVNASLYVHAAGPVAIDTVSKAITRITGQTVSATALNNAWSTLTFTFSPIGDSVSDDDANAAQVGLNKLLPLKNLYDLSSLNAILSSKGLARVSDH